MSTSMREALEAAVRCAKLALFVIRKQGVMPNSSWENGFNKDLAKAEAALSSPAPDRLSEEERKQIERLKGTGYEGGRLTVCALVAIIDRLSRQPEAEPVAWVNRNILDRDDWKQADTRSTANRLPDDAPLYTSPRLDREKVVRFARKFVEEQACGEWTDEIIERDAGKLADAIMRETR